MQTKLSSTCRKGEAPPRSLTRVEREGFIKDRILNAASAPKELETLYRANPDEFTRAFPAALAEQPDAPVLRAWNERLFFQEPDEPSSPTASRWRARDIWLTLALSLIAGTWPSFRTFSRSSTKTDSTPAPSPELSRAV